ncbi:MAG: amidohydrolase [Anaerolineaceae bacterium]|nr:amidohydrolase [Anaerolineaceae bacterium]
MLAITNVTAMTITQGTLKNATVLVEDGKISAVGTDVTIPEGATVLDGTGKVLTPGLIDAHCHTGVFGDGIGWDHSDGNEMTDPITPHLRALDALHPEDISWPELVAAGVTTVNTGPGSGNLIGGQWVCVKTQPCASVEEMVLLEPAGMKMALGENPRRVYGGQKRTPSTRMANAATIRTTFVETQNYMKKWDQYSADLAAYEAKSEEEKKDAKPPVEPDRNMKYDALARVLTRELRARIHCHRADDILTAIRIAEEFNLDYTIEHCTEGYKIAHILAEKQVPVTVGPVIMSRSKYELRNLDPRNPGILSKAGVKVAIQTDEMSAVKYLPINAALAVREGMDVEEALKAITINPAEIIGVADRVGSIEVGKDADLVLFSGHPFDYTSVAETVLIDGEIVYERN